MLQWGEYHVEKLLFTYWYFSLPDYIFCYYFVVININIIPQVTLINLYWTQNNPLNLFKSVKLITVSLRRDLSSYSNIILKTKYRSIRHTAFFYSSTSQHLFPFKMTENCFIAFLMEYINSRQFYGKITSLFMD